MSQSHWDCLTVKEGIIKPPAVTPNRTGIPATSITSPLPFMVGDPGSDSFRFWESPFIRYEPTPTRPQPSPDLFQDGCPTALRTFRKILQLQVQGLWTGLEPNASTHRSILTSTPRRSDKILKTWAKFNRELPLLGHKLAHLAIWQLLLPLADLTCLSRKQW